MDYSFEWSTEWQCMLIAGLHVTSWWPCLWCVSIKNKSISLLWEIYPIFIKILGEKLYCIDHQHTTNIAAFSCG